MGLEGHREKTNILLEDLASLESYARDLFSFLPLPVFLVSSIGIILEVNDAVEEMSGYKTEEIIGKPIEDLIDEEEAIKLSKDTIKEGFIRTREVNIITKEQIKIPVSVSTKLRRSEEGEVTGYFLGFFDLREIKKTEKELRKKIDELERFHKLIVGREMRMIELKREVERLRKKKDKT